MESAGITRRGFYRAHDVMISVGGCRDNDTSARHAAGQSHLGDGGRVCSPESALSSFAAESTPFTI